MSFLLCTLLFYFMILMIFGRSLDSGFAILRNTVEASVWETHIHMYIYIYNSIL